MNLRQLTIALCRLSGVSSLGDERVYLHIPEYDDPILLAAVSVKRDSLGRAVIVLKAGEEAIELASGH